MTYKRTISILPFLLFSILSASSFITSENPLRVKYYNELGSTNNFSNVSNSSLSLTRDISELNILALRVEFITDTLTGTTGNGKFNSAYPDSLILEGKPHDKPYFESHITYLKNYFESVSNNNISVNSSLVLDVIITVPHQMWYYNTNNGDSLLNARLLELHKSAWDQIKDDTSIPFADFNTFVMYHAGSGQEFSTEIDVTPFDIPSVYLNENDLTEANSLITTHDGTIIDNGIILPESEWQIFDDEWYFASLAGTSVLMIAHKIGIPNLYDEDGRSGVGRFDLMDQGSGNFAGLLPSGPSAWVRSLKGWSDVVTVSLPEDSIQINSDGDIFRVDINENEYFLLENRISHTSRRDSSIIGYDATGKRIKLYFDKYWSQGYEILDEGFQVLTRIENNDYDFAIPASGILIWHIDKAKTAPENIPNNQVNNDWDNKGVYLEEADGSFDIGQDYWLLDAGYGTQLGYKYDAFYDTNTVWRQYSNKDLFREIRMIEFSDRSFPISDSNERIKSGIRLYDFSDINDSMHFSFNRDFLADGFPISTNISNPKVLNIKLTNDDSGLSYKVLSNSLGEVALYQFDTIYDSFNIGENLHNSFGITQVVNKLIFIAADSLGYYVYDIQNKILSTKKITSSPIIDTPKYNTILTENGLIILDNENNLDESSIFENLNNIQDYALSYSLSENGKIEIDYITSITSDSLFITSLGTDTITYDYQSEFTDNSELYLTRNDLDGTTSIYLNNTLQNITVKYNMNGEIISRISYDATNGFGGIGDYDFDGKFETLTYANDVNTVYIQNDHGIYENGSPILTRKRTYSSFKDFFTFTNSSTGKKMLSCVDSLGNYNLYDTNGDEIRNRSFIIPGKINTDLSIFENEDIIYLSQVDSLGNLFNYNLINGSIDLNLDYNQGIFNSTNNRFLLTGFELSNPGTNRLVKNGRVYNWPNPATGDFTNFRFFLTKEAKIDISIYELSGFKVASLEKSFNSYDDYFEIQWDISDMASGVYIASVTVKSGSKEEQYTVKVAITK